MYSALLLLCLNNTSVEPNNCVIMQSNVLYANEAACADSIANFLNSILFTYSNYKLTKLECYEWMHPSELKI